MVVAARPLFLPPNAGDAVGRHHRFAVTSQVIEIGPVAPEEDLVSGWPSVNTVEVRDSCFPADFASGCRGRDADHVALVERVDVVTPNDRGDGRTTTTVVVPAKGVDGESRYRSADDDSKCAKSVHRPSLGPSAASPMQTLGGHSRTLAQPCVVALDAPRIRGR
jgi:hypothetical protein